MAMQTVGNNSPAGRPAIPKRAAPVAGGAGMYEAPIDTSQMDPKMIELLTEGRMRRAPGALGGPGGMRPAPAAQPNVMARARQMISHMGTAFSKLMGAKPDTTQASENAARMKQLDESIRILNRK